MPESYQSWRDRDLIREYEADPESFRKPLFNIEPNTTMQTEITKKSDADLLESIRYLKTATHLGSWGALELSKAQAEATRRKLNLYQPH
jgi:hypothetical protein